MLPDFSDSTSLFQNAKKEQLYQKLIWQLQKDFSLANVDVNIPDSIGPTTLKTVLHEKIYYLILEKFTEYLNLLYVVDVPEKTFKTIKVTDAVAVAEQVTFVILKRELQKVWLKAKYG